MCAIDQFEYFRPTLRRVLILPLTFATVAQSAFADPTLPEPKLKEPSLARPELDPRSTADVYRLSPEIDLPLGASIIGLGLSAFLMSPQHAGCGDCDPLSINTFDRFATQRDSRVSQRTSDILLYLSIASPLLIEALTIGDPTERADTLFNDTIVLAETLALTAGLTKVLKTSIGRPRPFMYRDSSDVALDSFPSGHSSLAFASAAAGCSLYVKRKRPSLGEGTLVCAPAFVLAATTAALRVDGGRHFPSDVLAGAVLGTAIGLFIPWLHGTF